MLTGVCVCVGFLTRFLYSSNMRSLTSARDGSFPPSFFFWGESGRTVRVCCRSVRPLTTEVLSIFPTANPASKQ